MKKLEQQQKEMRERNERTKSDEAPREKKPVRAKSDELDKLRNRVSVLERENSELRREIAALRQVSGGREKSYEDTRREQQHNYFKYSNARRY
jgi:predicted RNase H-like nuclease (RuvC/YqgF family)